MDTKRFSLGGKATLLGRSRSLGAAFLGLFVWFASASSLSLNAPDSEFPYPAQYDNLLRNYKSGWTQLTEYHLSGLHWDQFIVVYINKDPMTYFHNYFEFLKQQTDGFDDDWDDEADASDFRAYAEGTIVLKEHYTPLDGKPGPRERLTAMVKREPGYDSKFGDWQYLWFEPETGAIVADGNSSDPLIFKSCVDCHSGIAERDYIFSTVPGIPVE